MPASNPYISRINLKGVDYEIKDAQARSDIAAIQSAIAGGVHFRGISTTAIADNDNLKDLTVNGETYAAADQIDGDLFIYNNGTKNLEFVVASGKYSELGSTGELGALAFADSATGSLTVPTYTGTDATVVDGLGTLAISPSGTASVLKSASVSTSTATVALEMNPITIPTIDLDISTDTDSFTGLSYVGFENETLRLTEATATYVTDASGTATPSTVTPTGSGSVDYTVYNFDSQSVPTGFALTGNLSEKTVVGNLSASSVTKSVTVTPDARS